MLHLFVVPTCVGVDRRRRAAWGRSGEFSPRAWGWTDVADDLLAEPSRCPLVRGGGPKDIADIESTDEVVPTRVAQLRSMFPEQMRKSRLIERMVPDIKHALVLRIWLMMTWSHWATMSPLLRGIRRLAGCPDARTTESSPRSLDDRPRP